MIIEKNGKPYAIPPFNTESATLKVKAAENAWNSKDPARVALALLKIPKIGRASCRERVSSPV